MTSEDSVHISVEKDARRCACSRQVTSMYYEKRWGWLVRKEGGLGTLGGFTLRNKESPRVK